VNNEIFTLYLTNRVNVHHLPSLPFTQIGKILVTFNTLTQFGKKLKPICPYGAERYFEILYLPVYLATISK
jgi:hypothetical protein